MKKIVAFIIFTILLFLPNCVKAATCDYTYKAELRKKASNVMPSYTYVEKNNTVKFTVTFTNVSNDLYIFDEKAKKKYNADKNGEVTISNLDPGTKIKIGIYSPNKDCIAVALATKYVNLPYYNKFYNDPLCEGKTNYSVCYKWNQMTMTHEEFEKRIKELYNEQPKKEEEIVVEQTIFDKIYNFLHDYYIFIILGVGIIMIIIMYIRHRKNDYGF